MPAGSTSEKAHFTFIRRPELAEPPLGQVVLTFRAFYGDGGEGLDGCTVLDDDDLTFTHPDLFLHMRVTFIDFSHITAFAALQEPCGGDHETFTFRTEHQNIICVFTR